MFMLALSMLQASSVDRYNYRLYWSGLNHKSFHTGGSGKLWRQWSLCATADIYHRFHPVWSEGILTIAKCSSWSSSVWYQSGIFQWSFNSVITRIKVEHYYLVPAAKLPILHECSFLPDPPTIILVWKLGGGREGSGRRKGSLTDIYWGKERLVAIDKYLWDGGIWKHDVMSWGRSVLS